MELGKIDLNPPPADPHHLMLIKLADVPKNIQPLMMVIARDSHPSVDAEGHLLVNVHFDTVQEALWQAKRTRYLDLSIAVSILVASATAVFMILLR
jgi:hypothetical protein